MAGFPVNARHAMMTRLATPCASPGSLPGSCSRGVHRDPPRLRLRVLRDPQGEYAVLETRVDPRRVEFAAQRERTAIPRHAHLRVDRLQAFGRPRLGVALDQQRVALDLQ